MGTILIFFAFAIVVFAFMNRSNRNRRYNNRIRYKEKQDELLSILREKPNSNPTNERSPSAIAQDKLATEAP